MRFAISYEWAFALLLFDWCSTSGINGSTKAWFYWGCSPRPSGDFTNTSLYFANRLATLILYQVQAFRSCRCGRKCVHMKWWLDAILRHWLRNLIGNFRHRVFYMVRRHFTVSHYNYIFTMILILYRLSRLLYSQHLLGYVSRGSLTPCCWSWFAR